MVTLCIDDWGGSEELWSRCIPMLNEGTALTLYKNQINRSHPEYVKLAAQHVAFCELDPKLTLMQKMYRKGKYFLQKVGLQKFRDNHSVYNFHKAMETTLPDLVIVAQGINFDGLIYAYQCHLLKIPYVIIAQKAVDFYWPYPTDRMYMKEALMNADKCYFVSHHNKRLTEEQFGMRLIKSEVVYNPIKTKVHVLPFPSTNTGYRLACVGRLFLIDKGQDILLRILSQEKWRKRPISVSLVGSGYDEEGIKDLVKLLSIENVNFIGYHENIETIWETHHALILPSRSEGLPLSMLEAMSLGRTVIVSTAGGNAEVIHDGINGFIGEATETAFESAMERAWEMRDKWHEIGKTASLYIKEHLPQSPEREFANSINNLLARIKP